MNAEQFRATLKALDISQQAAARLLGVDGRTAQRWALGERDIPPPAARFLLYLDHIGANAEVVRVLLEAAEARLAAASLTTPPPG